MENAEQHQTKTKPALIPHERVNSNLEPFYLMVKEIQDYAILMLDAAGHITSWNKGSTYINGYAEEDALGKSIDLFYSDEDIAKGIPSHSLETAVKHGRFEYEGWRVRKDGTRFWANVILTPLYENSADNIRGFTEITRDITVKKRLQDEVKRMHESYASQLQEELEKSFKELADYKYALDKSSIVAITDQKGIIRYVNDNFCKISKYSSEELIGQDHRIINSGFHSKGFIRELWTTIANGKVWKGELKNRAKDGSTYWVDTTIIPFLNIAGKPERYIAIRSDITARKYAEEQWVKNKEIYKAIVSSIPRLGISIIDTSGQFIVAEGEAMITPGYHSTGLIGKKTEEVIAPEQYAVLAPCYKRALRGENFSMEWHTNERDLLLQFVPFINQSGTVDSAMTVTIDISEIKQAQYDIEQLNRTLELKVLERTRQLQEANKEMEAFTYSVSHDLRAPLRIIDGYSNILSAEFTTSAPEENRRLLGIIMQNVQRMGKLIDELLNLSRLSRKALNITRNNMTMLVKTILNDRIELAGHHAEIRVAALHPANCDQSLISQVWINLISNAIKYSRKREYPLIEISSAAQPSFVSYTIKDNGVGFDMKYAGKLFDVFQRLHNLSEYEGTGIGLALVQRIVLNHGGKVWAEATENEGATFHFSLPLQAKESDH